MSHEIKFSYITGKTLTYTVRQPDGTLRGLADIPLSETPPSSGYYTNSIARPDLVVGDMVIIKDSKDGNPVGAGEWKPEDANQIPITATGNWLWERFLDLFERAWKATVEAIMGKIWHN
jgi:hypothetical protein